VGNDIGWTLLRAAKFTTNSPDRSFEVRSRAQRPGFSMVTVERIVATARLLAAIRHR
jgi:hypothetical protein